MARRLGDSANAVLRRIANADEVFFFLDYDGTLSPLAPTPDVALPMLGTAELLQQLAATPGAHVAVVSGRQIAEVLRFLDVPGLYYVGVHGLEVRLPSGEREGVEDGASLRSILPAIKRRLRETVGGRPGILLEDKGAALACHYRLASPADRAAAQHAVTDMVREYRRRAIPVALMHGHAVIEIRPAHVNKGRAVCRLLAAHAPSALPAYIGDDRTDEDAFRLLPAEAITIRVGAPSEPTLARYRVQTPDDVQRFLRAVVDRRLSEHHARGSRRTVARAR